jgi:cytochrome P450
MLLSLFLFGCCGVPVDPTRHAPLPCRTGCYQGVGVAPERARALRDAQADLCAQINASVSQEWSQKQLEILEMRKKARPQEEQIALLRELKKTLTEITSMCVLTGLPIAIHGRFEHCQWIVWLQLDMREIARQLEERRVLIVKDFGNYGMEGDTLTACVAKLLQSRNYFPVFADTELPVPNTAKIKFRATITDTGEKHAGMLKGTAELTVTLREHASGKEEILGSINTLDAPEHAFNRDVLLRALEQRAAELLAPDLCPKPGTDGK